MSKLTRIEPHFFYGTAWKEDLTQSCVITALKAGFRAIDTANQRKHYFEEGVGLAIKQANKTLGLERESLFLQTKFTCAGGQDHRKPYDEKAPLSSQVQQSFESSLQHLSTDYLDSYILHGPSARMVLTESDWETWSAMEDLHREGKVRHLGISNVDFDQLVELYDRASIKPTFVQNRCFAETQWDKQIREFCVEKEILYQGFSLLTANWKYLGGKFERSKTRNTSQLIFEQKFPPMIHLNIDNILKETGKSIQQIVFRFAQQLGMIPMAGTCSPEHMRMNLEISDFSLSPDQLGMIENIAAL